MKKSVIYLSMFIFVFAARAQTHLKVNESKNQATKLLEEVSSKVKSYDNIVIEFEYDLRNLEAGIKQETRGVVNLKGEKYRLELMGTTRLFDGTKMYTVVPEDEEIIISTVSEENEKGFSVSKMLLFYEEGYRAKMDIVQNVHGRTIQYIKLFPTADNSEIEEILLGIDKQTKNIYRLIQQLKDGTQMTIKINSFKTNQPLSETLFVFQPDNYKDYYINRLN